jgi:hypothetical protein
VNPPPRNRRRQHPVNRRRPRPSSTHTAARRHSRWLALQIQRAGTWLRGLPERLRQLPSVERDRHARPADTAVSGKPLRAWTEPSPTLPPDPLRTSADLYPEVDTSPEIVVDPARFAATAPPPPVATLPTPARPARPLQRASELGKQLGRELAPRAAAFGRRVGHQLGPLARRGAVATSHGLRRAGRRIVDARPLLRLARLLARFFAGLGTVTVRGLAGLAHGSTLVGDAIAGGLQRHRGLLFALFVRALWWGALALLLLGGRALVEIHDRAPFVQEALPAFLSGLAVCAFLLVIASPARLRWAAFALGLGHGGLLALVWVVSAIA